MPGELHLDSSIMDLVRDTEIYILESCSGNVLQFLYTRQAEHLRKAEILAMLDTIAEFSLPVDHDRVALFKAAVSKESGI